MNLKTRVERAEKAEQTRRAHEAIASLKGLINALKCDGLNLTIRNELACFIEQAERVLEENNWNLMLARHVLNLLMDECPEKSPEYHAGNISQYMGIPIQQILAGRCMAAE